MQPVFHGLVRLFICLSPNALTFYSLTCILRPFLVTFFIFDAQIPALGAFPPAIQIAAIRTRRSDQTSARAWAPARRIRLMAMHRWTRATPRTTTNPICDGFQRWFSPPPYLVFFSSWLGPSSSRVSAVTGARFQPDGSVGRQLGSCGLRCAG